MPQARFQFFVPNPIAILDSCVLYPAPLRDLLIHLALTDLFRPRWTAAIHAEWMRNLLADRPELSAERLARTRDLMDRAIPDALVEGYEELIPQLLRLRAFRPEARQRLQCGEGAAREPPQAAGFCRRAVGHL
jgi:hypothetical protein